MLPISFCFFMIRNEKKKEIKERKKGKKVKEKEGIQTLVVMMMPSRKFLLNCLR